MALGPVNVPGTTPDEFESFKTEIENTLGDIQTALANIVEVNS